MTFLAQGVLMSQAWLSLDIFSLLTWVLESHFDLNSSGQLQQSDTIDDKPKVEILLLN
jgi:hypothetical protein